MKTVSVPSYPISIFIATMNYAPDISYETAKAICSGYCDEVGLCVTVTRTSFVYKNGVEPGIIVGLINYPRFPANPRQIWIKAEELAERLCEGLIQESYTIQAPDKTVWFSHRAEDNA